MEHKVCTIVGMGQGVSMAVAKRFGKEGFAIGGRSDGELGRVCHCVWGGCGALQALSQLACWELPR